MRRCRSASLADGKQTLVRQGVDITGTTRCCLRNRGARTDGTALQVLGRRTCSSLSRQSSRFLATITDLKAWPQPQANRDTLEAIGAAASVSRRAALAGSDPPREPRRQRFTQLADSARAYAQGTNQLIEVQLNKRRRRPTGAATLSGNRRCCSRSPSSSWAFVTPAPRAAPLGSSTAPSASSAAHVLACNRRCRPSDSGLVASSNGCA